MYIYPKIPLKDSPSDESMDGYFLTCQMMNAVQSDIGHVT